MAGRLPRIAALLLLTLCLAASGGCVSTLGSMIAAAPNFNKKRLATSGPLLPPVESILGVDEYLRIPVGPPEAVLAVSILQPRNVPVPRGTILVLHGMGARSFWVHGTAAMLADSGYRAVLVDLRGHGGSSGMRLTYGLREAEDLYQVLNALDERGLLAGDVGVYGVSYGATTAIHLAALDPRIKAVVAVSPFSDMRSEVSHYVRTVGMPGVGPFLSEQYIQRAVDKAGYIGGFLPDMADAAIAIQCTHAPVLLMHGTSDLMVPVEHSERLHAAAPQNSQLLLLEGDGHFSIWIDRHGTVAHATSDWFDCYLAK